MTDTWTTTVSEDLWESSTNPGTVFQVTITDADAGGGVSDHGALTGLGDNDHTQYQLISAKNQADGYAGLDGSGTVPDNRIPSTIARDTEVTAAVSAHDASGTAHPDIRALIGTGVDQLSFIYHPSGTAGDITYTSWSALMTDLAASHEPRKHIYFAESVTLPTGAHDLHGATLHGNGVFGGTSNGGITVTFPTGCTITNPATVLAEGGIVLYSTSTGAVLTIATADSVYLENDALVCAKSAAFFDVTATGGAQVLFAFLRGSGFVLPSTVLIGDGNYEALNHSSGAATCIVAMPTGNQTFADDTIRGSAIIVVQSAASGTSGYPETATGLSHANGSVFVIRHAQAFNIGYQQGTPEDWTTDPAVVSDALDELAARSSGGGTVDVVSNVATSRILGRTTAGTGDSEELTATQVRTLLGVGRHWKKAPPASSFGTGFSGVFGALPWDSAGNVAAEAYAAGKMVGGWCEVTGPITTVQFEISATSLTSGQAVILACYALDANGKPTGSPLWTESKDVGTGTGVQTITLSRDLGTEGCALWLLNPSGNSGSVSIYNYQPAGPYHAATWSVSNRPGLQVAGMAAAPDLTAYKYNTATGASAMAYNQRMPMLFLKS